MDLKEQEETVDLTDLVQNTDNWRAVVQRVMNFLFPRNAGDYSTGLENIRYSG